MAVGCLRGGKTERSPRLKKKKSQFGQVTLRMRSRQGFHVGDLIGRMSSHGRTRGTVLEGAYRITLSSARWYGPWYEAVQLRSTSAWPSGERATCADREPWRASIARPKVRRLDPALVGVVDSAGRIREPTGDGVSRGEDLHHRLRRVDACRSKPRRGQANSLGAFRGLRPDIVHRDLKPGNFLLQDTAKPTCEGARFRHFENDGRADRLTNQRPPWQPLYMSPNNTGRSKRSSHT